MGIYTRTYRLVLLIPFIPSFPPSSLLLLSSLTYGLEHPLFAVEQGVSEHPIAVRVLDAVEESMAGIS